MPNDHTPMKSFDEFLQSNMDTNVPENNSTPECMTSVILHRLACSQFVAQMCVLFHSRGLCCSTSKEQLSYPKNMSNDDYENDQSKMKNLMSIKLKAIERHKRKQKRSKAACAIQQWWTSRVMPSIRLWQEKKLKKKFDKQLQMLGSSQGDSKRNLQGCDGTVQDATSGRSGHSIAQCTRANKCALSPTRPSEYCLRKVACPCARLHCTVNVVQVAAVSHAH